jgi:hypothetical protein
MEIPSINDIIQKRILSFTGCPGFKACSADRKKSFRTSIQCEECSAEQGKDVFLCNDTKSGKPVLCHLAYHKKYHDKKYTDKF